MHIIDMLMLYSCPFREISMSDNFFYHFAHVGEMFISAEGILSVLERCPYYRYPYWRVVHITEMLMLYSCPFREISMFILAEGIIIQYLTRYVTQTLRLMTNADLNTSLEEVCVL